MAPAIPRVGTVGSMAKLKTTATSTAKVSLPWLRVRSSAWVSLPGPEHRSRSLRARGRRWLRR